MKKIIKLTILIIISFLFIGCGVTKNNNLDEYLNKLEVLSEVSYDFYLPRILNGEGDHIIMWESDNEGFLKVGNIISITGLQYYIAEVNQDEKDHVVKLKAIIEMENGFKGEKVFEVKILEDKSIKEEKIRYAQEVIKQYNNISVKESLKLPRVTEKYGLELIWISNNENVITSSGEYIAPEEDIMVSFSVNVLYNGTILWNENIEMLAISKNSIEKELFIDFVVGFSIFGGAWDSAYSERSVDNVVFGLNQKFSIVFSRADKQSGTIVDRPVMAAKSSTEYVTINLEDDSIKTVEFSLTQWNTKTFDSIYLEYFDGTQWIKCSDVITTPGILNAEIESKEINRVRLSFSTKASKNVQMGLEYIKIELN